MPGLMPHTSQDFLSCQIHSISASSASTASVSTGDASLAAPCPSAVPPASHGIDSADEPQSPASLRKEPPAGGPSLDSIETGAAQGEQRTYADILRSHCPREWKATQQAYSWWDAVVEEHRCDKLEGCKSGAWFIREKSTGQIHVQSNACHQRWCPLCSQQRSMHITETVTNWLKSVKAPKILTVTLKHSSAPVDSQINALYGFFRRFRATRFFRDNCRGGIWFFQIKQSGPDNEWHPHIHCLIDSGFMHQRTLSNLWYDITKGSSVVDIRRIYRVKQAADYVARYAARPAKLSDLDLPDAVALMVAMHGKKICGTWGTAKVVSLRPSPIYEADNYESIGSFEKLMELSVSDSDARAILEAWRTKTPYTGSIYIGESDIQTVADRAGTHPDLLEYYSHSLYAP